MEEKLLENRPVENPVENPMGTANISGLVLKTGLPLMISLLINSLYNFVDSVFVARISEDALTALSLAAPVQIIMSAMGLGIAVADYHVCHGAWHCRGTECGHFQGIR